MIPFLAVLAFCGIGVSCYFAGLIEGRNEYKEDHQKMYGRLLDKDKVIEALQKHIGDTKDGE